MQAFENPVASVDERLDEIAVMARDWEPTEHAWPVLDDIIWLRTVLAGKWSTSYPQPYIGTGPEDAMICLYWISASETVTLEINTVGKTGYLCRSYNQAVGEEELALDIDLTSGDAWRQIASELGVEVDRYGNVLAASLEQSVPRGENTGSGIPA